MNIWEGKFPEEVILSDGFLGPAPVLSYEPNAFGVYNMVGNVWEWVAGGTQEKRVLRGGSFVDSRDGTPTGSSFTPELSQLNQDFYPRYKLGLLLPRATPNTNGLPRFYPEH
jgi:Sulfatase-modifying factor enzyme 1